MFHIWSNFYDTNFRLFDMEKSKKELDKRIMFVAEKLQRLRKEKGYTSYENFALDNGLPRVQYWRMERGTNFTIGSLLKVLDIHQITLKEFFEEGFEEFSKRQ